MGVIIKKRQFECFLWRETEQKMYREPFLMIIFSVLDTIFFPKLREKITRTDEKLSSKTNYTQQVNLNIISELSIHQDMVSRKHSNQTNASFEDWK